MKIDKQKCIGCKSCQPYCTVGAILTVEWQNKKKSEVNQENCVECGACFRSEVCPKDAIYMPELAWPRSLRSDFSNPYAGHPPGKSADMPPAEIKLNELTGRIKEGMTSVTVEMGRPGLSSTFRDAQTVCMAVAKAGGEFEPTCSITALMEDLGTGKIDEKVLDEKGLSIMIQYNVSDDLLSDTLKALNDISQHINTVFSLSLANRVIGGKRNQSFSIAEENGFTLGASAKINVGLGRKLDGEKENDTFTAPKR